MDSSNYQLRNNQKQRIQNIDYDAVQSPSDFDLLIIKFD